MRWRGRRWHGRDVGMSEQIGVVLVFAGLALATLGLPWLAARAVATLWRRPVARGGRMRRLLLPASMVALGLVIGGTPLVYQRAYLALVGLGERERVVDGERMLTLTGWDRGDYSILAEKRDVVVLDMGNPDVGDDTLSLLQDLPLLRELSLNDSAVTDRGLPSLARLPALESLRIARTKVTPAGIEAFLAAPPPKLRQLDVSGNGIPTEILRAWKNAGAAGGNHGEDQGGRRYVN